MPLEIIRKDITEIVCDAIVNISVDPQLGREDVDNAIYRAAGPGLIQELLAIGRCEPGQAKYTAGYQLPCRYVIHTICLDWSDDSPGKEEIFRMCYQNSLNLAQQLGCQSVAFPLIPNGIVSFPVNRGMDLAVDQIDSFLENQEMNVYIAVNDGLTITSDKVLKKDVLHYIFNNFQSVTPSYEWQAVMMPYYETKPQKSPKRSFFDRFASLFKKKDKIEGSPLPPMPAAPSPPAPSPETSMPSPPMPSMPSPPMPMPVSQPQPPYMSPKGSLETYLEEMDESFCKMLLRKIDERGLTDSECYHRANVTRQVFYKIRNLQDYKPTKPTVCAFAVALKLDLEETEELLMKAGYALSHSIMFDIIVEYFVVNGRYDIYEINEALFDYDQPQLGARSA